MGQVYRSTKKEEKPKREVVKDSRGKDKPYRDSPEYGSFWTRPTTTAPSSLMSRIAQPLMESGEQGDGMMDKAKLYGGAFLQSFGDRISEVTSPLSAMTAGFASGGAGSIGDKLLGAIGKKVLNKSAGSREAMFHPSAARGTRFDTSSLDDIFSPSVPKTLANVGREGRDVPLNKAAEMLPRLVRRPAPKKQFHKYSENLNDSRNGHGQAFRIEER